MEEFRFHRPCSQHEISLKLTVPDGGIGDPNAILVRPDGSFLVSDDATDEIFLVDTTGSVTLFTDAIGHPNGMAFSNDGRTLYVAQIFSSLRPEVGDERVWAMQLEDGVPAGPPELFARLPEGAMPDGLAMDIKDRLYVAAPRAGQIWRVDPATGERLLIAENMPGVASLAFGRGAFDHQSIYATSTRRGGGVIWQVYVGVIGAPLNH